MSTTTRTTNGPGALLEHPDPFSAPGESWVSAHLPILAPTLLALALTAWRYDTKPLWRDEVYTLTTAGRSLPEMFGLLLTRDAGLTVYYLLMHAWLLVSQDPARRR